MPGPITSLSETQIIADMRRELRRLRSTAASQTPIGKYNEFTLASSSDSAHTLSFIPSLSLIPIAFLNGLAGRYGTDYTVDFTTGIVTWSATKVAGDILEVFYQTTGDLVALSGTADTGAISDTFNRANSTSTINPASDGGTWTDDRNAWGISGNQAYVHGDSGSGNLWDFSGMVIHRDLGSVVQTVQIDVNRTAGGNNSRIYWSLTTGSPGSAYALVWNLGNDFQLYKSFSNGTSTSLAGPLSCSITLTGGWHTIKVTYDGAGTSRFYVDGSGTPFSTYTDATPLTGTRVGIGQYKNDSGTNYLYDNFSALPS